MTRKDPTMNEKASLSRTTTSERTPQYQQPAACASMQPPAYSQSAASNPAGTTILIPTPPFVPTAYAHIPLSSYRIPDATLSLDKTTQTIYSAELTSSPTALEAFLAEQIKLPPRPTVRIIGRIPNHPMPLFDVQLDLFSHVAGTASSASVEGGDGASGRWAYTKVKGMDEMGSGSSPVRMDEKAALFDGRPDPTKAGFGIRRFCADGVYSKKLILRRTVSNWDTAWLLAVIRQLISGMGYRGPPVDISFPIQYSTIVIHSPHKHAAIVTGLHSLFVAKTKAYEPLEVVWPYANAPRSGDEGLDRKQRQCVMQTEEEFIREWRDAIAGAIADRRRGWLGESDKVEACMMGLGKEVVFPEDPALIEQQRESARTYLSARE